MKTRASIENLANEIRIAAGQESIPVDPFQIAKSLGCKVVVENFSDELSGILLRKASGNTIAVSASDGPQRRRFTIAHECGHLALEHAGEVFIDKQVVNRRDSNSSLAIDNQEIEANQFAASLLMPRDEVVSFLDNLLLTNRNRHSIIESMASAFKVSRPAMEYRLVNLGLIASPDDEY
jgi:Zn-dependent peptidase ImmA (M78 family)